MPLVLLIFAVLDLRTELVLLVDHFTLTSLITAITAHPLALTVLLAQPSLWRRYGGSRRSQPAAVRVEPSRSDAVI